MSSLFFVQENNLRHAGIGSLPQNSLYRYQYTKSYESKESKNYYPNITLHEINPFQLNHRNTDGSRQYTTLENSLISMLQTFAKNTVLSRARESVLTEIAEKAAGERNEGKLAGWKQLNTLVRSTPITTYNMNYNTEQWIRDVVDQASEKLRRLDRVALLPLSDHPVLRIQCIDSEKDNYYRFRYLGSYHRSLLLSPLLQGNANELQNALEADEIELP